MAEEVKQPLRDLHSAHSQAVNEELQKISSVPITSNDYDTKTKLLPVNPSTETSAVTLSIDAILVKLSTRKTLRKSTRK